MPKPRKKPGRPCTLGKGATYQTVKLRADQVAVINRLGGYIPGNGPAIIRDLIDAGLKAKR